MADEIPISGLTAVVTATGSDTFPVVQAGVTLKETADQLISKNNSIIGLAATSSSSVGVLRQNGTVLLNTYQNNLFLGASAGNFTMSAPAQQNIGIGLSALDSITTASNNCVVSYQGGASITTGSQNCIFGSPAFITTGSNNILIGFTGGENYTSNEASNILLGAAGTALETNICRIGTTGSGAHQITDMYLAGILHTNNFTVVPGGNISTAGAFTTSGAFAVTQTYTGITNVTFPTTGTLATTTNLASYLPLTGGVVTGDLSVDINAPNLSANFELFNTSSTGTTSNANLSIITRQAGGGDPAILWSIVGSPVVSYYAGIDNTDDTFKIGLGTGVGVTTALSIDNSTGVVSLNSPLPLASGGTNASLVAANGAIPYSTASAIAFLAAGSSGQLFRSGGAGAPTWTTATYPSTATGTGTILRANGTNWVASTATYPDTAGTSGKVLVSDGTNFVSSTPTFPNASATSGKIIQSDGTNWISSTPTYPSTAGTAGKILRSDGTNLLSSTSTFADTYSASTILYSNGANTVTGLATANNGVLQTSSGGVPSISTLQTYSPTIGDGTNNFTTSTAQGYSYRVGALTFVNINLIWTNKGSAGAGNVVRISLPITSSATPSTNTFTPGYTSNITSLTPITYFSNGGDAYIQIANFVSGSAGTSILVSSMGTSGQIQLSGWIGN